MVMLNMLTMIIIPKRAVDLVSRLDSWLLTSNIMSSSATADHDAMNNPGGGLYEVGITLSC
jgi:hypothetical protein